MDGLPPARQQLGPSVWHEFEGRAPCQHVSNKSTLNAVASHNHMLELGKPRLSLKRGQVRSGQVG